MWNSNHSLLLIKINEFLAKKLYILYSFEDVVYSVQLLIVYISYRWSDNSWSLWAAA